MKNPHRFVLMIFVLVFVLSCSNDNSTGPGSTSTGGTWLIPSDQIKDGGPGKDGIPALTNPAMISVAAASYINDNDLVIGIKIGNEIRVYPHAILDWHEIINDDMGSAKYSITYCPLTGSGMAWDRVIDGQETTFGVSGLLYNTNLIPYDRATNSNWAQMRLQSVNGTNIGKDIELLPVIETTWGFWKQLYPDSRVVSSNTGVYSQSQYERYPYGDYRTNHNRLLFSVSNDDKRLPRKERVLGIIVNNTTKVFRFSNFGGPNHIINTDLNGVDLVVAGSNENNFIVAFERKLATDNKILEFSPLDNNFPNIMTDQEGNKWNVFGEAVDGPRKGTKLTPARSYMAYWFAWGTFWPNAEIYGL